MSILRTFLAKSSRVHAYMDVGSRAAQEAKAE